MTMKTILTAAALAVAATGAQAVSVTFNLEGDDSTRYSNLTSSFSLTQDGLTATFDGKAFNPARGSDGILNADTVVQDARIGRFGGGAGVVNSPNDGSHTTDGRGFDDFIQISFDAIVEITQISFGFFDRADDFRVLTDVTGDGSIGVGDGFSSSINVAANNPFSDFNGLTTNVFGVGAFGDNDSWKLRTVTVTYDDEGPTPSNVPLPAAGWLILGAFGGLGALRRFKKA